MTKYKLVPVELTEEMLDAAYKAAAFPRDREICVAMYKAMFAAAPEVNPWVSVWSTPPKQEGRYLCIDSEVGLTLADYPTHFPENNEDCRLTYWWNEDLLPIPRPKV